MARHTAKSHKIRKVEILVIQIANYEKGKLTFTASFFEDGSVAGFRLAD